MLAASALDQAVEISARLAGRRTLVTSARRTVLLMRNPDDPAWHFPIGVDDTRRVDAEFRPALNEGERYTWAFPSFALGCHSLHPDARTRLEMLDQFPARADATTTSGENMSTEIQRLQRQLDALQKQVGPPAGDRKEFTTAQARADSVYKLLGLDAPGSLAGETYSQYVARLIGGVQHLSPRWKGTSLEGCTGAALTNIAADVYADAAAESSHPTSFRPGVLIPIKEADPSGRVTTRYVGDPHACWDQFNPPVRHIRRFLTPGSR